VYASLRELPAWVSYWLYQPQRYYGWLAHDPASTSFYLLPAKTDSRTACQQGTLRGCVTILYTENVSIELRKMLGNDVTVLGIPMNSIQNDVHSLWILPQEILAGERSNIEIMLYKFKTTE
jgi:hypothetical protein